MYRHFIAPSRCFTPFDHEIIRHPRLCSDAVRLLTWQLSLPEGARESLSRTAERAGIRGCAFTRAKRQLMAEGFVHELRTQGPGGRWETRQLVSNRPLSAAEAAKLLGGRPPGTHQVAPGPRVPAVGEPTTPGTDGPPKKDPVEDTSNRPAETEGEGGGGGGPEAPEAEVPEAEVPEAEVPEAEISEAEPGIPEEARLGLIGALPLLSPALRFIPRGMRDELARLAARWLTAGHSVTSVHDHILRSLPRNGTPVHRPGGLVRYLLREVTPLTPVPSVAPPAPGPSAGPRVSARLAEARECEGAHLQPMLFRPVGEETLCAPCADALIGTTGTAGTVGTVRTGSA
ncbi:hypothetical protein [Streptomyces sp. NPDC090025]|uniref:hypothetical protein n=1 Tax=Streptomyces sp. NPDC090025 TaxID=3365922 RepID=UPI00383391C2